MADIRKEAGPSGRSRQEAMQDMRAAMRQKNECLEDGAHCDNARRAIIQSLRPVMALDRSYFQTFFKQHQQFALSFNDYKYVEELCVVVCAIEAWYTPPGSSPEGEDALAWIGGLDLHLHASMYFGFSKADMLRCFQIVQRMKELEIDALVDPGFQFPELELPDTEAWMLYYVAAVTLKFREGIAALEARREELGVSVALRADIIGAVKSTFWWRYMLMARSIEDAAQALPAGPYERVNQPAE